MRWPINGEPQTKSYTLRSVFLLARRGHRPHLPGTRFCSARPLTPRARSCLLKLAAHPLLRPLFKQELKAKVLLRKAISLAASLWPRPQFATRPAQFSHVLPRGNTKDRPFVRPRRFHTASNSVRLYTHKCIYQKRNSLSQDGEALFFIHFKMASIC